MPTDPTPIAPTPIALTPIALTPIALFLFAHQDDEFGVFHRIECERRSGRRVVVAYLTDGATPHVSADRRNAESLAVLQSLGVAAQDIHFAGTSLGIADSALAMHLRMAMAWVAPVVLQKELAAVYIPAWEGGHPDHDALHAGVANLAREHGLLGLCRQFSLYNSRGLSAPWFRVLSPIAANGPVSRERIPVLRRLRYLRLCLSYHSQAKSWVGLLPFVALHYLLDGTQALQPVNVERLHERPHEGQLYYEARGFATWQALASRLAPRR